MAGAAKRSSLADRLLNESKLEKIASNDLFSEEPVPLDVFLYDKKFMDQDMILGPKQYDLIRHMEQIYLPEMYPYMVEQFGEYWNPVRYVNFLNIQWGKGAGKDFAVTLGVSRCAYLLLCLNSPQQYFGISRQSDIHILNVAMNAQQARRAFFKPLGQAINHSPWFTDKLTNEITDQGTSIRLKKQVELISGHSQVEGFEGLSPIVAVCDEISGFQSEEHKATKGIVESQTTAEAVYGIVKTSASTRFPINFKVAAISYPRFLHDPIQNLCAEGEKDIEEVGLENSPYYVDGPFATWEVNPRYKDFEMITIPQTDRPIPNLKTYITDYKNDAAKARAKYECRPERAANRFMRIDSAINEAFPKKDKDPDWIEPLKVSYYWGVDLAGARAEGSYELANVPGWHVQYELSPHLVPMEGAIYTLHADLAVKGDRAGIAMCHVKNWERREFEKGDKPVLNADYQNDDRPIIKLDFVSYYEADMQALDAYDEVHPREIQIRWFRNLVRELRRRGFTIGLVTFDNFQSTDSIQTLNSWGIEADKLSVDRNNIPYVTLREVIYDGRLEGYYNELLIEELEGLNQLPNNKIDHPPGGSKDLADAVCGAVTNAVNLGGDEGEAPEEVDIYADTGYEVANRLGSADSFWGNTDFTLSHEEFNFTF